MVRCGCVSSCARVWPFAVADARKVKGIAPLAGKTDRVDARVLAQLARRDLVPELWVLSLSDRELRQRLRRRGHQVRLKTSARNRMFGVLTQWGLRGNPATLRRPGALERSSQRGGPAVWIQSVRMLLAGVDDLERRGRHTFCVSAVDRLTVTPGWSRCDGQIAVSGMRSPEWIRNAVSAELQL